MIDLLRALVAVVALVDSARRRCLLGVACAVLLVAAMALVGAGAAHLATAGRVSGEYGFALAYVGPTMVPFGGHEWLPTLVQVVLTAIAAVPVHAALWVGRPMPTPWLVVFVPNAMLLVLTALGEFLLWRQVAVFPEYWGNP